MTKLERVVGFTILLGCIWTLDIVFFDHIYSRASTAISHLTQSLSP